MVVDSGLDVYAHNIETVERLQYRVRDPRAGFDQSLAVLNHAREYGKKTRGAANQLRTKSSIMLGLGESDLEIMQTCDALRTVGVDVLTLGQYLRPSLDHLPVEKYYTPDEFTLLGKKAQSKGFLYVASGPMVRSSYRAAEHFLEGVLRQERGENHGTEIT